VCLVCRVVRELTVVLQSAGGIADTTEDNLLLREGLRRVCRVTVLTHARRCVADVVLNIR
jgi:hypothetical protein